MEINSNEIAEVSLPISLKILDTLHHPVLLVNSRYTVLYLNEAMVKYIELVARQRLDRDGIIGRNVIDFHPPKSREGTTKRLEEVFSGKNLPPRFNVVGGTMFTTYDNPILNEDEKVVGLLMEKIPVCIVPE